MKYIYIALVFCFFACTNAVAQTDPILGEIKLFSVGFAPRGWAKCEGQLLPINQNQALFSLLGTTYGGDGRVTFALPDYRGRAIVGLGLNFAQGQKVGDETVVLSTSNLPVHNHDESFKVSKSVATSQIATANAALSTNVIQVPGYSVKGLMYNELAANVSLDCGPTSTTGSSSPLNVMQPYIAMTYMIAIQGVFPTRN